MSFVTDNLAKSIVFILPGEVIVYMLWKIELIISESYVSYFTVAVEKVKF